MRGGFPSYLEADYRVVSCLGTGRCRVFVAEERSLKRFVVIKCPAPGADPFEVESFRAAHSLVASVSHPNLVRILACHLDSDPPAVVQEHVEGFPLKAEIRRLGRIPLEPACEYMIQLAEACLALEEAGLIHCNLKPRNILVSVEGSLKLGGFSLVRRRGGRCVDEKGMIHGTPSYMSPEHALGEELDVASDIYSCGMVFYEILCGTVPFRGDDPKRIMRAQVEEIPPSVREYNPAAPRRLRALVAKMLNKDPAMRYGSFSEVRRRLEYLLGKGLLRPDSADAEEGRKRETGAGGTSAAGAGVVAVKAAGAGSPGKREGEEAARRGRKEEGAAAASRRFLPRGLQGVWMGLLGAFLMLAAVWGGVLYVYGVSYAPTGIRCRYDSSGTVLLEWTTRVPCRNLLWIDGDVVVESERTRRHTAVCALPSSAEEARIRIGYSTPFGTRWIAVSPEGTPPPFVENVEIVGRPGWAMLSFVPAAEGRLEVEVSTCDGSRVLARTVELEPSSGAPSTLRLAPLRAGGRYRAVLRFKPLVDEDVPVYGRLSPSYMKLEFSCPSPSVEVVMRLKGGVRAGAVIGPWNEGERTLMALACDGGLVRLFACSSDGMREVTAVEAMDDEIVSIKGGCIGDSAVVAVGGERGACSVIRLSPAGECRVFRLESLLAEVVPEPVFLSSPSGAPSILFVSSSSFAAHVELDSLQDGRGPLPARRFSLVAPVPVGARGWNGFLLLSTAGHDLYAGLQKQLWTKDCAVPRGILQRPPARHMRPANTPSGGAGRRAPFAPAAVRPLSLRFVPLMKKVRDWSCDGEWLCSLSGDGTLRGVYAASSPARTRGKKVFGFVPSALDGYRIAVLDEGGTGRALCIVAGRGAIRTYALAREGDRGFSIGTLERTRLEGRVTCFSRRDDEGLFFCLEDGAVGSLHVRPLGVEWLEHCLEGDKILIGYFGGGCWIVDSSGKVTRIVE